MEYFNKLITTFETIDTVLLIVKPTIKSKSTKQKQGLSTIKPINELTKQKYGQSVNSTNKKAIKNCVAFGFFCVFGFF